MRIPSIGTVLGRVIGHYEWEGRLTQEKAKKLFLKTIDPALARTVTRLQLNDGILYVRMNSAAAKENLLFDLSRIRNEINRKLGREILRDIRLR